MKDLMINSHAVSVFVRSIEIYFEPLFGFFRSKYFPSNEAGHKNAGESGGDQGEAFQVDSPSAVGYAAGEIKSRLSAHALLLTSSQGMSREALGSVFENSKVTAPDTVIKVVGVGGGGTNAVAHMMDVGIDGVDLIVANTDSRAINDCGVRLKLQLGRNLTKGRGAGANPEIGRQAALEDIERIMDALHGADIVFIIAGMGGGTGTGAAPVIAQLAKEMGILTVAVVTKPFPFEGRRRMQVALKGIEELLQKCDSLITISNETLITVLGRNATMVQAFCAANNVVCSAVQSISSLMVRPGLISVDFADVRAVMFEKGLAMIGTGTARGDDRAQAAAEWAINNPMLDDVSLAGANGVLVNITAGPDFTMAEFNEVGRTIESFASEDATIVIGTVLNSDIQEEVKVTVIATGLAGLNREFEHQHKHQPVRIALRPSSLAQETPDFGGDSGDYIDIPVFLRRQGD